MAKGFSPNDIFEIAIRIEKNGTTFYNNAAEKTDNEEQKKFLLELADMEKNHVKTFTNMKNKLKEKQTLSEVFDPDDENSLYLKALADTRVFFQKKEPDYSFKGILRSAIQAEKDSIVFYLGMKEMVSTKDGKTKIDEIIKEEMNHIRILAGKLSEYNKP